MLGWGFYALQDWRSFLAQSGAQLARKASRHPLAVAKVLESLRTSLSRHDDALAIAACVLGLAGLCLVARTKKGLRAVVVCQVLLLVLLVCGGENWYLLYLTPLTALGLGAYFIDVAKQNAAWRVVLARRASLFPYGSRNPTSPG